MTKLTRDWRPIESWEETRFNMWGSVQDKEAALYRAILFTGNYRLYGLYMQRIISEWPNSCANALTDYNLNRRAWIGHAACALALSCPEDVTREAWRHLTNEQRILANRQADRAIQSWEVRYRESLGIRSDLAAPMLFTGHSRRSAQKNYGQQKSTFVESSGNCHIAKRPSDDSARLSTRFVGTPEKSY